MLVLRLSCIQVVTSSEIVLVHIKCEIIKLKKKISEKFKDNFRKGIQEKKQRTDTKNKTDEIEYDNREH